MSVKTKNTILIIDDDALIQKMAATLLEKKLYKVILASDGKSGIAAARKKKPDVILLDVMMPEVDGYEVLRQLKSNGRTKDIPVIMVSGKRETVDKVKGLESGTSDYITKPFDFGELTARVETQLKLKKFWDELQEKNKILEKLARKDGLTNLLNHKYFQKKLIDEYRRAQRYHLPLSCVMIDIDYFKKVNDDYGHQAGDKILKSVAEAISGNTRNVDVASRYGGEEFALLLPHTEQDSAVISLERIRKLIENTKFIYKNKIIKITISIGIADFFKSQPKDPGEFVSFADQALYRAKNNGRNQTRMYNE